MKMYDLKVKNIVKKILWNFIFLSSLFASDKCLEKGHFFENNMKEISKALDAYLEGVNTNNISCLIEASRLYSNEENKTFYNPEKSYELLSKALVLEPFNSLVHYNLGIYYFNFNTEKKDFKSRYHFVLALFLGDKDAQIYVNQLHKSASSLEHTSLVAKNKKFDKEYISQRLEHFFKDKIKIVSKDENKIVLKSNEEFTYTLTENELKIEGLLDIKNALFFGNRLKYLQYSLYVDLPLDVENQTNEILDSLFKKILMENKLDVNEKFIYEEFEHKFRFLNESNPIFTHIILFKK